MFDYVHTSSKASYTLEKVALRRSGIVPLPVQYDHNLDDLPFSKKEERCSSEKYVVNKAFKENGVSRSPVVGGRIRSSVHDALPLETKTTSPNKNLQSDIKIQVTEPPIAQNGNASIIATKNSHIQVSQSIRNGQTVTVVKALDDEGVSEVTQNNQKSEPVQPLAVITVTKDDIRTEVAQSASVTKEKTTETVKPPSESNEESINSSVIEITNTNKLNTASTTKEIQSKPKSQAPQPPQQNLDEIKTSLNNKNNLQSTEKEGIVLNGETEVENVKNQEEKQIQIEENISNNTEVVSTSKVEEAKEEEERTTRRRSGIVPLSVQIDEDPYSKFPSYPKTQDDEALIKEAIQQNDFLSKIISGKKVDDVVNAMYNKEVSAKETIVKQGDKGSHMYISAKGRFQVLIKNKPVSEFSDVRVFGELAILYNAKRLATIKALTPGRVWVLDRNVYQQIAVRDNIRQQDEIMQFLMNNEKLKVVGQDALQEVAGLLKSEFFKPGTPIVRQGDKGNKFYIIRAGTVTITKDGEGVVGLYKKGDCFGELALLKEDCRQATVTADAPGVECLTLTRKQFVDHFGELKEWEYIHVRPQDSLKGGVTEYEDIDLRDLRIIRTLGVGGFGRVELVQHKKNSDLVFALKYLKKIDIVMQHQQEHVYNEKNIQMACKTPFIVRLYRTYRDNKYIYLLMESCLGGDLWSLLQKQKLRRFDEKEARFIAGCVLEAFEYLHSRGIIYRDLKPENLLIAVNGYIKLTDFGFAKKISSRGKTFTFAGTPEYVAPEIVLNRGHDRSVDYWAFGAFIFELLTGRTPFRTDDSSHMKTYNKILSGIDNVAFPSYVNLKARHIIEKLCRPIPSERLGMQKGGIKNIKEHKWFLGFDWQKLAKCEMTSPFKPKLKSQIDTQYFDQFKKDADIPPDELSGWDTKF